MSQREEQATDSSEEESDQEDGPHRLDRPVRRRCPPKWLSDYVTDF